MAKRIIITGGSGLIGTELTASLRSRGDDVVVLGRGDGPDTWDPANGRLDPKLLQGADAVVNLNGAGIGDKRWSDARKQVLISSRTAPTSLLAETIAAMDSPPGVFVSQSAIGYYGDTGDRLVDESAPAGDDFHADICVVWEASADPARKAGVRVVHPRTGLVLSHKGGLLGPIAPLFKLGVGGKIGNGSQWWSWIGMQDEVRALEFLIDEELEGPVNLVGPEPVTNAEFAKAFGSVLGRPALVPVPKFAIDVRLGKEAAESIGYGSLRIDAAALRDAGFEWTAPTVTEALKQEYP